MTKHKKIRLQADDKKELLCFVAGSIFAILYCFWALNLWNYDLMYHLSGYSNNNENGVFVSQ